MARERMSLVKFFWTFLNKKTYADTHTYVLFVRQVESFAQFSHACFLVTICFRHLAVQEPAAVGRCVLYPGNVSTYGYVSIYGNVPIVGHVSIYAAGSWTVFSNS